MTPSTFIFHIPYPPSINTYWGFHGHRRFLTAKANDFKTQVAHAVSLQKVFLKDERLRIEIILHAPDKRVRDIDNVAKPTLDALVQAGLFNDDSQVDVLLIVRGIVIKGGAAQVSITPIKKDLEFAKAAI